MNLTSAAVAAMIDHTNLKPNATRADFEKLCLEAAQFHFKSVAINPAPVRLCRELLAGTGVLTGAAIAFPLGQLTLVEKCREAEQAILDGAQEFDYVLNIGRLVQGDLAYIEREMQKMTDLARAGHVTCKVILETCYLTDAQIQAVCQVAASVRPDFVKTSTGFGSAGATRDHVALMKAHAGTVSVKAAGGIRTYPQLLTMAEAGATRIGTSAGVSILKEMEAIGLP